MAGQALLLSASAPFAVGLVPLVILTFDAGRADWSRAVWGLIVAAAALGVTSAKVPAMRAPGEVLFSAALVTGVWLIGRYTGRRQRRADELASYAARLQWQQDEQARAAIAEERDRIARELHDIVAHSVSVMGVQAGAARTLLDRDPARARDALILIEATARDAVGELRRMLGMLRSDRPASDLAPQPGLADLTVLLAKVREAGLCVDLSVKGVARPLSPGVDLAAYRIVQEALTNALKHAGPCRAEVLIRYNGRSVELHVVDDGRGQKEGDGAPGTGHGLVGMRERAVMYGGWLDAGPAPQRGFRVRAQLPTAGLE